MSTDKSSIDITTDDNLCQSNKTTSSSTVVTRRNQQIYTQQIVTSRKIQGNSSTIDNTDTPPDVNSSLVPSIESTDVIRNTSCPKSVRTTTKTYRRRIIRRIGPNGEVSEEIIEEGEPICSEMLSIANKNEQDESDSLAITSTSKDINKMDIAGAANFQATVGFKSVSDTGEEQTANFSTGPIQTQFRNINKNMITDSNMIDETDNSKGLSTGNSGDLIQEVLSDGSTVTRKFFTSKTSTVTHSSTINGETKTSSQSAFMCYTGESILQAKCTMDDMEVLFNEMTSKLKGEGFDVLNRFMLSSGSNITDHLALAGGDSASSLLAIGAPEDVEKLQDTSTSKFKLITKPLKNIITHELHQDLQIPKLPTRDSIIRVEEEQQEEVRQKIIAIKEQKASNRLYWSHMDEVRTSGILSQMNKEEIHLQEGIFEIITSEASYNISLDILIDFYYKSELLNVEKEGAILTTVEKHWLFSNILLVKGVSLQFLKDLETRWSQSKPKILDLADIILKHAEDKEFEQQYVNYLANQSFQINALKKLLQKESFKAALLNIQSNPKCCKLSLDSFLALPMQRLTRLKLLIDVVLKLMHQSKELLNTIPKDVILNHENALKKVKELLNKSESKKFEMEQKVRLNELAKILEFGNGCKTISFGTKKLIKEGEVKAHLPQLNQNALKKLSKKRQPIFYLIVLSDLVIIAKRKSPTKIMVLDYCEKELVEVTIHDQSNIYHKQSRTSNQIDVSTMRKDGPDVSSSGSAFILKFGKSESEALTEPLLLNTSSIDDRDQWINAIQFDEKRNRHPDS